MLRSLNSLTLLVVATVVFAACQPPNPGSNPGNPATLDFGESQSDMSSDNVQLQNTQVTQEERPSMPATTEKTLADFKEIPASQATIKTTKGDITFELYRDEVPLTTANFVNLAREGFYDGIVFHRVIPDFMAQVGDPLTKDPTQQARWGTGGPGYVIADEFSPNLKHDGPGVVSMANAGANTGGSQFFITYEATPWLDGQHAVFGKVTAGMDVLEQITQGDSIISVTLQ